MRIGQDGIDPIGILQGRVRQGLVEVSPVGFLERFRKAPPAMSIKQSQVGLILGIYPNDLVTGP